MTGSTTRWRCSGSTLLGALVVYALQRFQALLPLNPQDMAAVSRRFGVQHRDELRHQHQLAGLRRREHDELPHADARPRRAELRLRRVRHGRAGGADPRLRAQAGQGASATSGSTSCARRSTSCCRCRSCSPSVLVSQGVVQTFDKYATVTLVQPVDVRRAEERTRRPAAQGRQGQSGHGEDDGDRADDPARAGRVADRHQAARHQRRRLLQRQFGASVRESDAA